MLNQYEIANTVVHIRPSFGKHRKFESMNNIAIPRGSESHP